MLSRFQFYISAVLVLCLLLLSSRSGVAQFNGYDPSYYYLSPSRGMPTYMTSINYPWVYGAYDYPHPPGIIQNGLQRSGFSTGPNLYSVYATPPANFAPAQYMLDSALRPVETTAYVSVWVPAGAELRFQGIRTDPRGTFRRFTTPPLIPGREYTYDIDATWTENGRQVTRTRHVPVRAGDRLYVDFRTPETTEEGTRALRTRPLR